MADTMNNGHNDATIRLIIDSRERHILRHEQELAGIDTEEKQITVGDYAVMRGDKIMVVMERKSLDDAATSMKDGRWNNREKLFDLRRQTGCKIVFIIEGYKGATPNQPCAKYMPYSTLESSLFHMMVRDDISVIWTRDTLDTAATLVRFVKSMGTLSSPPDATIPPIGGGDETEVQGLSSHELLTKRQVKQDIDIVRAMWACFRGISATSADEFIAKMTIADIIRGAIPKQQIEKFKRASGKTVSRVVADELINHEAKHAMILSCVPGVSRKTAEVILANTPLPRLLSYEVGAIAMIPAGKTRVGDKRAERIKRLMEYTK